MVGRNNASARPTLEAVYGAFGITPGWDILCSDSLANSFRYVTLVKCTAIPSTLYAIDWIINMIRHSAFRQIVIP